jgi:hypothetical protein
MTHVNRLDLRNLGPIKERRLLLDLIRAFIYLENISLIPML